MRRDDDPSFSAMFEHVRDVACLPMSAAGIGHVIPFPGLNHSHLAEDSDCRLVDHVFEIRGAPFRTAASTDALLSA